MPPKRPAAAGLIPILTALDSTSEAVKSKTAPFVEASIHAYEMSEVSDGKERETLAGVPME